MATSHSKRKSKKRRGPGKRYQLPTKARLATGETVWTEYHAETNTRCPIPREMLCFWGDGNLEAPFGKSDRLLRCRVLMHYAIETAGYEFCKQVYFPDQDESETVFFDGFLKVLQAMTKGPKKCTPPRTEALMQAITVWLTMASFDYEDDELDSSEGVLTAIERDCLAGKPTRKEVDEEYRRWYESEDARVSLGHLCGVCPYTGKKLDGHKITFDSSGNEIVDPMIQLDPSNLAFNSEGALISGTHENGS